MRARQAQRNWRDASESCVGTEFGIVSVSGEKIHAQIASANTEPASPSAPHPAAATFSPQAGRRGKWHELRSLVSVEFGA
jgi:hypothetical protein